MKRLSASRNGEIDFWKFIFSIIIVLHHSYTIIPDQTRLFFSQGSVCVDFFLIISGYLMVSSVVRRNEEYSPKTIGSDTVRFIKGKIQSLLYYYIFSSVAILTMHVIKNGFTETFITGKLLNLPFAALFLNMSGLDNYNIISSSWYLSAMFLSMAIIYPILRKNQNLFTNVIAPLTAIFLYGYLIKTTGYVGAPDDWLAFAYKGLIRGIAGIALGCTAYNMAEWLKSKNISKSISVLLSMYETLCIIALIYLMHRGVTATATAALVLFFFSAFIIMASKKASINYIYQYSIFSYLGKLSMTIFLIHGASHRLVNILCEHNVFMLLWKMTPEGCLKLTIIYTIIAVLLGVFCIIVCDNVKEIINKIKERNQKKKQAEQIDTSVSV